MIQLASIAPGSVVELASSTVGGGTDHPVAIVGPVKVAWHAPRAHPVVTFVELPDGGHVPVSSTAIVTRVVSKPVAGGGEAGEDVDPVARGARGGLLGGVQ